MTLYYLKNGYQSFVEADEVYPDVHLGVYKGAPAQWCLVVGCTVVVIFDDKLQKDLETFYDRTWNKKGSFLETEDMPGIVAGYNAWLGTLEKITEVKPFPVDRRTFAGILASAAYRRHRRTDSISCRHTPRRPRSRRRPMDICRLQRRRAPANISIALKPGPLGLEEPRQHAGQGLGRQFVRRHLRKESVA